MDPVAFWDLIARARPTPVESGVSVIARRVSPHGEPYTIPVMSPAQALADEGSYFTVINPTLLTGLATVAAPTTADDTKPFIILHNNDAVGGRHIKPDYIRLLCTAAGTAGTSVHVCIKLDKAPRYTSGSTLTTTPKNVNMGSGIQSVALVYAGPLVAAAASTALRTIAHSLMKSSIPAAGDEFVIKFGATSPAGAGQDKGAADESTYICNMPPVSLGPGDLMLVHLFLPSQSAASSYELDMGFYER